MKINRKAGVITAQMDVAEAGIVARALGRLSEAQEPRSFNLFSAFREKLRSHEYNAEKIARERDVAP